jgi:mono/diheme cytochrome c family protein
MSTYKWIVAVSLVATGTCGAADTGQSPHLGHVVTQADLAAWDISIAPDGTGLPPGSGTAKQGEVLFAAKCAACHGAKGIGPAGPPPLGGPLVGGSGTLTGDTPVKTVGSYWPYATTLFDYVRRAMPFTQPQSLTNDEVYALAAYILNLNGIIDEKEVMNAKSLPKVKMPNRAKFFSVYPKNLP